jgi:hypothetical protein
MIRRTFLASLVTIALLILAAGAALAVPNEVEGSPPLATDELAEDESAVAHYPTGYYVWHTEQGWHLRTHGPGERHHFSARLQTDGTFYSVDARRLEEVDHFAIVDGGRTLVLDFDTYEGIDGVDFRIHNGSNLRFSLRLNGELISTERIYLGSGGAHPRSNPFRLSW